MKLVPGCVALAVLVLATAAPAAPAASTWRHGRVSRVYGAVLSRGDTPTASAEAFLAANAGLLGTSRADLVASGGAPGGPGLPHVVPLMYDRASGTYRFTSLHYAQARGGVGVFRSRLTLLVRNEPGHPVVLAACDLRDLGDFEVERGRPAPTAAWAAAAIGAGVDAAAFVGPPQPVIFAGLEDAPAVARPAVQCIVRGPGHERWLYVLDAASGAVLHRESLILHEDIVGTVSGRGTVDLGADICGNEDLLALPYARVTAGGTTVFADASGAFTLPVDGPGPLAVQSQIRGPWFRVFNDSGLESILTLTAAPPGPVVFQHNASNQFEFERAQVNAYVHANAVRDFVLSIHPDYPVIGGQAEMTVNVNINDSCNAFYSPSAQTINFFTSGEGCPNTAYDTIVYHEYGHHLIQVGGSGQGAYGEGMADTVAVLVTDQPVIGYGWRGDCADWLRNADNDCQYSPDTCTINCGSQIHACGRLLSGSVWSLRNELLASEPSDYREILASLTLGSILLHTGSLITPDITVDFLTLDDDNGTILDGTPHFDEIAAAFGAHGLDAPPLALLSFEFPGGLPDLLSPFGDATIRVEVGPLLGTPQPASGLLHVRSAAGAPFDVLPMIEVAPNVYDAVFPELECGALVEFYFSAETTQGAVQVWPQGAPDDRFAAIAATGRTSVFTDDFEADLGWSVTSSPDLSAGAWERGVPAGEGDRGDPLEDADGSGSCFLTGNAPGNSDVDQGTTMLTSPPMDVGAGPASVSYQRWFSNAAGDNPFQDLFVVEASGDGGKTWHILETVGPAGPETGGGWFGRLVVAGDLIEPGQALTIRFHASDSDGPSIVEAAIDAVEVEILSCGRPVDCPADIDRSGDVDVSDLTALILAWGTADPAADIDGSGLVDVADLVELLLAFGPCR